MPTAGPGPVNQDTSEVTGLSLKYFSGVNLLGGGGGSGGVCLLFLIFNSIMKLWAV